MLFLGLLLSCRKQLSRLAPSTPLSASIGFLCAEYRKRWFVWEVAESVRKLFFVSLVRLVSPGTLSQLLVYYTRFTGPDGVLAQMGPDGAALCKDAVTNPAFMYEIKRHSQSRIN